MRGDEEVVTETRCADQIGLNLRNLAKFSKLLRVLAKPCNLQLYLQLFVKCFLAKYSTCNT